MRRRWHAAPGSLRVLNQRGEDAPFATKGRYSARRGVIRRGDSQRVYDLALRDFLRELIEAGGDAPEVLRRQ